MKQKQGALRATDCSFPPLHKANLHKDLKKYVGYCFYKAAARVRAKVDQRFEPFGLVAPQFGMLTILKTQGPISQGELCQFMAIDKATMVRLLDILEKKSLLTRTQSKADRRANYLKITKAGEKILLKLDQERMQAEEEFLSPLTDAEKKQFVQIIGKLTSE